MTSKIRVIGAREHNLKNISVEIPKNSITVVTGPSGSGKSTLALDIVHAEGQRRYMESLSSYARQFLGMPKKPDVDRIEGLCPSVAIDQKTVGKNPRSTVGTITEIYDYIRVLFARIGFIHCPQCHAPVKAVAPDEIAYAVMQKYANQYITVSAPVIREKKGEFFKELEEWFAQGYHRFLVDGVEVRLKSVDDIKALGLKKTFRHSIAILIDKIQVVAEEQSRILEACEKAFALAQGSCSIRVGQQEELFSSARMCLSCARAVPELEPRLFSFNSPIGACKQCSGLGIEVFSAWDLYEYERAVEQDASFSRICSACQGKRLKPEALWVLINGVSIYDICSHSIKEARAFFDTLVLDERERTIAQPLINEIVGRLTFLCDVGVEYLSLHRQASTLSGGEGQRIRLATQIGAALSGVVYVLDEPSIGLHQRDNDRLIATLHRLRDQGNTVLVVEHDHDTMEQADYLIDMGPAAGVRGGQIVSCGTPEFVRNDLQSLTGAYLSGRRVIPFASQVRIPYTWVTLKNASANNLHTLTTTFPLGVLCSITGVSGSGKSSLVMQELVPAIKEVLTHRGKDIECNKIEGVESLENMVVIDQSPIGRTPRSNPATYLGIFDDIRKLFASLPESNARGYTVGRFSFNVGDGRCSGCSGDGVITVSMHFLPDVVMTCTRCKGTRYNVQTLEILYKGKSIADVLAMTAYEALEFFAAHTALAKRLRLLCDVGLDYVALGQPSTTLSGGEAQRIKLVDELAKRGNKTLYVLDEPTTGLHASDIERLLVVFNRLVDKGNTVLVIEHNLDVIRRSDYIIDLGPEGGKEGGRIVARGTPAEVAQAAGSYTGYYLQRMMNDKG